MSHVMIRTIIVLLVIEICVHHVLLKVFEEYQWRGVDFARRDTKLRSLGIKHLLILICAFTNYMSNSVKKGPFLIYKEASMC